uniref:Uncharacterized protein n=1 Tax=Rhizophora mucronata TaxID=61149 RepID=A0A2P2PTK6_RHIMU
MCIIDLIASDFIGNHQKIVDQRFVLVAYLDLSPDNKSL